MLTPVFIPATGAFEIVNNYGGKLSEILLYDFGWTGGAPVVIMKTDSGPFSGSPGLEIDIPGAKVIIESGFVIAGGSGSGLLGGADAGLVISATCYVENNGIITGGGGGGGIGSSSVAYRKGLDGGAGVYATTAATFINKGTIQGGGGGGGAGVYAKNYAGGGGGAGYGNGGVVPVTGPNGKGGDGISGTLFNGGLGGDDLLGGTGMANKGGNPAQAGLGGGDYGTPGNGGPGIQGSTYITLTNNGTITGSQI